MRDTGVSITNHKRQLGQEDVPACKKWTELTYLNSFYCSNPHFSQHELL